MKPTLVRNRMIFVAPQHIVSKQLGSRLSKELRTKYHHSNVRVIVGDSVKVLRGEFKGIEGKVTHVSTEKRGIAIEGIKREKLKGGNVDIYIHPSNVIITDLNLKDKWRQSRLEKQKPKTQKSEPTKIVEKSKDVPKDTESTKGTKETSNNQKLKKDTMSNKKSEQKEKTVSSKEESEE